MFYEFRYLIFKSLEIISKIKEKITLKKLFLNFLLCVNTYFDTSRMRYFSLLYSAFFNTNLNPYLCYHSCDLRKKYAVCCNSFHVYVESRRCYKTRTFFQSKDIRADRLLTCSSVSPKWPDTTRAPVSGLTSKLASPVLTRVAKFLALPSSASKFPWKVIPRIWNRKYIFVY